MNAHIHPVFAELLAPFAPPSCYDVTIRFADGIYKRQAFAISPERAVELALIDARMGSPFGTHFGKLIDSHAELAA